MALNAADVYRQQAIQTNNPSRILLMVFDGAIAALIKAKALIDEKNIPDAHNQILRVQELVAELILALDFQYEISNNLAELYQYIMDRLIDANVKKDNVILDEVIAMLSEMRDMWQETSKLATQVTSPNQNDATLAEVAAPQSGFSIKG